MRPKKAYFVEGEEPPAAEPLEIPESNLKIKKIKSADGLDKAIVESEDYNAVITRDYYGKVDTFYLSKKDPNYEYRFLRDDHKNISMKTNDQLFDRGGWQVVPKKHLEKLGLKANELSPDGMLRRGDQILFFMPKELFLEKEEFKKKKATGRMDAIQRRLKKGDPNEGGRSIHETMKGIQTASALGMGSDNPDS